MSKRSGVGSLSGRQASQARSRVVEHKRVEQLVKNGGITKTAVSQGIAGMRQAIQNDQNKGRGSSISWIHVKALHDRLAHGIVDFATAVYHNHQTVTAAGRADRSFDNLVITATKDSQTFTDRLLEIKSRYEGREGIVDEAQDLDLYYSVGEDYGTLYQEFQHLAFQVTTEITAYLSSSVSSTMPEEDVARVVANALNPESQTPEVTETKPV